MAAKWKRSVATLTLGLAVLASSCTGQAAPTSSPPLESVTFVRTAKVTAGSVSASTVYPGNVQAKAQVNVVPKVAGAIKKLNVDVGSQVKAGDVLAEIDSAAIEAQVAQAEAALALAQARLASIDAGPRVEMVAQAEANARAAAERVASLESAGRPETIAAAQANARAAAERLASLKSAGRPEAVAVAQANARAAAEKVASLKAAGRPETIAQAEANARAAQARLDQLEKGTSPEAIDAAKLVVEQAKNGLAVAEASRAAACAAGPSYQCDAAILQVNIATTSVGQAEAQLALLTAPPSAEQLAQAQAAVDAANQQVLIAKSPVSSHDIAAAQALADAANQQVELARRPVNEHDIAAAQAAVDAANQQVALAREPVNEHDLAAAQAAADAAAAAASLARQPFTENDRKVAQAGVDQAKAAVDGAKLVLRDATIAAPFDGVVAQRYLAQGAMAAPTTPIVAIISSEVEVVVNVEEARMQQVAVGQRATITVTAYPGEAFPASVVVAGPSLDPRSRTRVVKLRPEGAGRLLDGMYAQVSMGEPARAQGLVVPAVAVLQRDGKSVVFVARDGRAAIREVALGARDDASVEVVAGLAEGEAIVVSGQGRLSDGQAISVAS